MKKLIILTAMLIVVAGCSQEVEVKEVSISDLAKEMEFIYLKCENDYGYSYEDITQSPDKLISKYKSLYSEKFDNTIAGCVQDELNIDDCHGVPSKVIKTYSLNFNFLNISNDIPDVKTFDEFRGYEEYKENKIVFSLANKAFFAPWGHRTPNAIPMKAYSSLEWISHYPPGQMWDLNRETLELSVYTSSATLKNYSCEISDKDHYEKAGQALDYLVNEFTKVTYYGEAKKEFTDRYNEKLKSYKASIQKEKKEQLEKNKI